MKMRAELFLRRKALYVFIIYHFRLERTQTNPLNAVNGTNRLYGVRKSKTVLYPVKR